MGTNLSRRLLTFLCASAMFSGALALAQSPELTLSDDELTLVVGTRFVSGAAQTASPKTRFDQDRIPVSAFNDTDTCIDNEALELAKEYFTALGRTLARAGFYYVVPEEQVQRLASVCEAQHGASPKAWIDHTTTIIAFGRVVPTTEAPDLERSIR